MASTNWNKKNRLHIITSYSSWIRGSKKVFSIIPGLHCTSIYRSTYAVNQNKCRYFSWLSELFWMDVSLFRAPAFSDFTAVTMLTYLLHISDNERINITKLSSLHLQGQCFWNTRLLTWTCSYNVKFKLSIFFNFEF